VSTASAGANPEIIEPVEASQSLLGGVKRRLVFIDALRALAIIAVFYVHGRAFWVSSDDAHGLSLILDRIAAQGSAGVDLFIVLSGFCMAYPLTRGGHGLLATVGPLRFLKRRAIRLFPAYYTTLVLLVIMLQFPSTQRLLVDRTITGTDVIATALFVQPFDNSTLSAINGPLWSISLEVCLYLLFPLTLWLLRRFGWIPLIVVSVVAGVVWLTFAVHLEEGAAVYWLPGHYFEFVLGMAVAFLVCNPRPRQTFIAALAFPISIAVGGAGTIVAYDAARVLGWGAASAALTLLAARSDRNAATRNLVRLMAPLGVVSYSFYLLHQPAILLAAPWVQQLDVPPIFLYPVMIPIGLLIMGGLAWLFYRAVERPFLLSGGMRDAIRPARGTPVPFAALRG
jgi:peptidoglycan/LPS O-acetylase OafA/YrhL